MNNSHSTAIQGLYGITPDDTDLTLLLSKIRLAAEGGMKTLQFRRKNLSPLEQQRQAQACQTLCKELGVTFIINDNWSLAIEINADGVHLGKDDGDIDSLRQKYPHLIIGASCYDQLEMAYLAAKQGASYVAFGAIFPSNTKPNAVSAPLELFKDFKMWAAKNAYATSTVAIGGIDTENAKIVYEAGADSIATIQALFDHPDTLEQAKRFSQAKLLAPV